MPDRRQPTPPVIGAPSHPQVIDDHWQSALPDLQLTDSGADLIDADDILCAEFAGHGAPFLITPLPPQRLMPVSALAAEAMAPAVPRFTVHVDIVPSDGAIKQVYGHIACPAVISRDSVTFVDLDLDPVRGRDADRQVLDEDE